MPDVFFRTAAATDVGRRRAQNQDAFIHVPDRGLFGVIDGVGGHAGGDVAARLAWETIGARFDLEVLDPERALTEALVYANNAIVKKRRGAGPADMACVATIAFVHGRRLYAAHVGDTRLYKLRPPEALVKLTHDHSLVGVREDEGELSEVEAMRHPRRHEILRDLGAEPHEPEDDFVELLDVPFEADAAFLLCTDGLTDLVPGHDLEQLLLAHAGDPRRTVEALIEAANARGGTDNITAVVVEGLDFSDHRHTSTEPTLATRPTGALSTVLAASSVSREPALQASFEPEVPTQAEASVAAPPVDAGEPEVEQPPARPGRLLLIAEGVVFVLIVAAGVWLLLRGDLPGLIGGGQERVAVETAGQAIVCSPETPLQPCLDAAQPGDTLVVPAGTYTGPLRLPADVFLRVRAFGGHPVDTVSTLGENDTLRIQEPAAPSARPDTTAGPE